MSIVLDGSNLTTGGVINVGTAVASTSGTAITFTGIPSTAKRITVMFQGVGTSGTSPPQLQIGSGSTTTSGYVSNLTSLANSASAAVTNVTSGFVVGDAGKGSTSRLSGTFTLTLVSGNIWVNSAWIAYTDTTRLYGNQGYLATLSGALDRVVITTINGTDTFTAGSINIFWE